jgi:hypothetical protein
MYQHPAQEARNGTMENISSYHKHLMASFFWWAIPFFSFLSSRFFLLS